MMKADLIKALEKYPDDIPIMLYNAEYDEFDPVALLEEKELMYNNGQGHHAKGYFYPYPLMLEDNKENASIKTVIILHHDP